MKKILRMTGSVFLCVWKILTTGTALISGLFMLSGIGILLFILLGRQAPIEVADGSALVLAPYGNILEKKQPLDPVSRLAELINGAQHPDELLLQDIISGIRAAANDKRIKLLVLSLDKIEYVGLDQLRDIAGAIDAFKKSGKTVISYADTYGQGQYYLASRSDEIYLNPMGSVNLRGFGIFNLYMLDLLNKLNINFHIFRVGTFKSAVEPLIRNDMSPAAKEANRQWLTRIWQHFLDDITGQRNISPKDIDKIVNQATESLKAAGGDSAQMALNTGLIDGLKTENDFREYIKTLVGTNQKKNRFSFKQVNFTDYLTTIPPAYRSPLEGRDGIAIIVAQGDIVYGDSDKIGSAGLTKALRKVRQNKKIKAVVLRIDSGGGSVFASELIRQEVLLVQQTGKPVIVSMGAMAASGGYWIAANADKILASPNTITGSIGVFGVLPSFEKTLSRAGVFSDGVGTTKLAGEGGVTRPMSEDFGAAVQANVEHAYQRFLEIVAEGRGMEIAEVDKIAQGRVWDGETALEIGLVDQLGGLNEAVAVAAEMVGLPITRAFYFQESESPAELLLRHLEAASTAGKILSGNMSDSGLGKIAAKLIHGFTAQYSFLPIGDPKNMYSHCLLPFSVAHAVAR